MGVEGVGVVVEVDHNKEEEEEPGGRGRAGAVALGGGGTSGDSWAGAGGGGGRVHSVVAAVAVVEALEEGEVPEKKEGGGGEGRYHSTAVNEPCFDTGEGEDEEEDVAAEGEEEDDTDGAATARGRRGCYCNEGAAGPLPPEDHHTSPVFDRGAAVAGRHEVEGAGEGVLQELGVAGADFPP